MATIQKGLILREDLNNWDGITKTATRIDATGGTITGVKIGDAVDVLMVYGSGTEYTADTILTAVEKVPANNMSFIFATGTWVIDQDVTIPSHITAIIPTGCIFNISAGVTLTFNGNVLQELQGISSGSGTLTYGEALLNKLFYAKTAGEISAGITPTYWQYIPGSVLRYGAVSGGVIDDTTPFQNAHDSGHPIYIPANSYLISTLDISGGGEKIIYGDGATKSIIISSETTTSIIKSDNTAAASGTVTRTIFNGFQLKCSSYQASMSAIKADGHTTNSTPAGVSYSRFEDLYISNCGKGIDLSRTWAIKIDHCRIYSCAQPLVIDKAGNLITSIATTYLGLTDADVSGGAAVDDLIFLTEVRGATFTGGSIEGNCDRWINCVNSDGIEISGNFIEVKPTNPARFETTQGVSIQQNYIRYKPSTADAALNNVFVYADGSETGRKVSVINNSFSIYDKPTSGNLVFTGVGASATNGAGIFHFEGNSLAIEQLGGDPVHVTDYYMDPTIASLSNNFTCIETRTMVVKQGEFIYTSTTPNYELRGMIANAWGYQGATSELFVNQTVQFREITSGTDPVSGQYNLITTDLTRANTAIGNATSISLNNNVNVAFTFTSASASRVTPRHRISVQRNSADASTTSSYEAEITIHECPVMAVLT